MSTLEGNREHVRRFLNEIWSHGDLDTVDEILTADFAFILAFVRKDGIEDFKNLLQYNRTAFENLTYRTTEEDIVVDEDKGAAYWYMSAKHVSEWAGIPATDIEVAIEGISFFRFRDGRISEARVQNDVLGLMRQLGAIPPA